MPRNNSKKRVFSIILVAVIIFGALLSKILWPASKKDEKPQLTNTKNVEQTNNKAVEEKLSKKIPTLNQRLVVYSTPKVHDQWLISSSLEGTNIDGAIQADQNKQLILNISIRDFFDYFLTTVDEIGYEKATQEIKRYINQALPEPARTQANELLIKYLHFKQAEYQIQQTPIAHGSLNNENAIAIMRESYEALKLSRQTLFSTEQNSALFALEDTYAEHTLSVLELMADESLSNEERNNDLQKLEANLPPELSNSFAETKRQSEQSEFIQSAVNSGLDNAQVYDNLVGQGLSNEQANKVIARRQQQVDFNNNYETYSQELSKLDQNREQYTASKAALLKRFFSSPEEATQAKLRDLSIK